MPQFHCLRSAFLHKLLAQDQKSENIDDVPTLLHKFCSKTDRIRYFDTDKNTRINSVGIVVTVSLQLTFPYPKINKSIQLKHREAF